MPLTSLALLPGNVHRSIWQARYLSGVKAPAAAVAGEILELAAMELQLAAMKLAAMAVMELAAMELAITLHGA